MNKLSFSLLLLFFLSAGTGASTIADKGSIVPIVNFAYPAMPPAPSNQQSRQTGHSEKS
jgi:hypothetical protein